MERKRRERNEGVYEERERKRDCRGETESAPIEEAIRREIELELQERQRIGR